MRKWMLHTVMLLTMLLAACTPRIYGVPQNRWETMSEQERIAAMDAYKARQEAVRQQREEQARLRAIEKRAQLEREAEEAHRRQLQIDAIYRGEGLYGDLLRVNLEGGKLQFYGDHKPYGLFQNCCFGSKGERDRQQPRPQGPHGRLLRRQQPAAR